MLVSFGLHPVEVEFQTSTEVVNLRETFEDENFVYMVMELCQGGELAPCSKQEEQNPLDHGVILKGSEKLCELCKLI